MECGTSEKKSGCEMSGWNVGREEFRMQDVRMECRRGGISDAMCPDGINVVMSSMKDRYGLYGHGGLGEWF